MSNQFKPEITELTKWRNAEFVIKAKHSLNSLYFIRTYGPLFANYPILDTIYDKQQNFYLSLGYFIDESVKIINKSKPYEKQKGINREKAKLKKSNKSIATVITIRNKKFAHKEINYKTTVKSLRDEITKMEKELIEVTTLLNEFLPELDYNIIPYDRALYRSLVGVNKSFTGEIDYYHKKKTEAVLIQMKDGTELTKKIEEVDFLDTPLSNHYAGDGKIQVFPCRELTSSFDKIEFDELSVITRNAHSKDNNYTTLKNPNYNIEELMNMDWILLSMFIEDELDELIRSLSILESLPYYNKYLELEETRIKILKNKIDILSDKKD